MGYSIHMWASNEKFYAGDIVVTKEDGRVLYTLELNVLPEDLEHRKYALFKIIPEEMLDRK